MECGTEEYSAVVRDTCYDSEVDNSAIDVQLSCLKLSLFPFVALLIVVPFK